MYKYVSRCRCRRRHRRRRSGVSGLALCTAAAAPTSVCHFSDVTVVRNRLPTFFRRRQIACACVRTRAHVTSAPACTCAQGHSGWLGRHGSEWVHWCSHCRFFARAQTQADMHSMLRQSVPHFELRYLGLVKMHFACSTWHVVDLWDDERGFRLDNITQQMPSAAPVSATIRYCSLTSTTKWLRLYTQQTNTHMGEWNGGAHASWTHSPACM